MANKDAPFGFRPVGELGSNIQNGGTTEYDILPGLATVLYKGDLMQQLAANGTITSFTAGINANVLGVFNGCYYVDPTTLKPTWSNYYPGGITPPGSGPIKAYVYDDPNKLFECQANGTVAVNSAVGKNTDMVYAAGSTVNGQSNSELNVTTGNGGGVPAAATAQFRVIAISRDPDNSDASNDNANWIVKINESVYTRLTGV